VIHGLFPPLDPAPVVAACARYQAAIRTGQLMPGDILPVEVRPGQWVVHHAGQAAVGRGRQTDDDALARAIAAWGVRTQERSSPVGLPYDSGYELVGGDWRTIAIFIARYCPTPSSTDGPRIVVPYLTKRDDHPQPDIARALLPPEQEGPECIPTIRGSQVTADAVIDGMFSYPFFVQHHH